MKNRLFLGLSIFILLSLIPSTLAVTVEEKTNVWGKAYLQVEPEFNITFNTLKNIQRDGNCIEMTDWDGYFSAIGGNATYTDKYIGVTDNDTLSGGWLAYRNLDGSNPQNITSWTYKDNHTYWNNDTHGNNQSYYFNNVYYYKFATIPNGTEKNFRFKVCFNSRPDFFVLYFGSGSTAVQITQGTFTNITNGVFNMTIDTTQGYAQTLYSPSGDIQTQGSGYEGWLHGDFAFGGGRVAIGFHQDGLEATVNKGQVTFNFITPPMALFHMWANQTPVGYSNAGYRDVIILGGETFFYDYLYMATNRTGAYWSIASNMYTAQDSWWLGGNANQTYSCGGGALKTASTTAGLTIFKNDASKDQFIITWDRLTDNLDKWACESSTFMYQGVGSLWTTVIPNNTAVYYRTGWVKKTDINYTNAFNVVNKYYSILKGTSTITNKTGGCVQGMYQIITSDLFTCDVSSGALNVTITPFANVTSGSNIYLKTGNWTTGADKKIYIYKNSTGTPTKDNLLIHLVNESGVWKYVNDGSLTPTNATIDAGTYNYTGIVDSGSQFFLILQTNVSSDVNLIVTNISLTPEVIPTPSSQSQSSNSISVGQNNTLSANWTNVVSGYAWLSTNETGSWQNKTGVYNSPITFGGGSWSNFTWNNSSMTSSIVGWKVYANNSDGKEGVTNVMTFIIGFNKPVVNTIQCYRNATEWTNCNQTIWNNNITQVRINCTDPDNDHINSIAVSLFDEYDNHIRFQNQNFTSYAGELFVYDCADQNIDQSGYWNITATCSDAYNTSLSIYTRWLVAWGHLEVTLNAPSSYTKVQQNATFWMNGTVTCVGGECASVGLSEVVKLWADPTKVYR